MKTQVGMWIDHREANIVFLSSAGEKTRQIKSNVEKQRRRADDSRSNGSYETQMVPERERKHMGHLANYYEEVFLSAHGADTVFIFGPGEAKGELRKQFQKRHFSERIVGFESADQMTPRQISEKVRNFYRTTPAILLKNGD
jgi:hypothetical protein